MNILVSGGALYLISFILQVIFWRIRLPKNQTRAIAMVYLGVLFLFLIGQGVGFFRESIYLSLSAMECLYLFVVYCAALPTLLILYTMIESESPSGLMVLTLHAAGDRGVSQDAFFKQVTDELLVWNRVEALQKGGYLVHRGERYFITQKGVWYMHLFLLPRYLMGRSDYGG